MSAGDFRVAGRRSQIESYRPTKLVRLSQLRKLRQCEQVAAVCYRVRRSGIEFLLVRTRKDRWTFPKGSAMTGLTHAQAAALEAFEEAGVHGRMEEAAFTRYVRRRTSDESYSRPATVQAHLCEVLRLAPPQEPNRNPAWFSAQETKKRLREHRDPSYGNELARVVSRAVARIGKLRATPESLSRQVHSLEFTVIDGGAVTDRDLNPGWKPPLKGLPS